MLRCFCALDNITIFKWLNMILEWFCICLCVHVHLCVNAQLEASGWQVSSSIISALIFFIEFFTEPGAHWFGLTGWPASPKDLPVSLPRTGVIDSAALPGFVTWCWDQTQACIEITSLTEPFSQFHLFILIHHNYKGSLFDIRCFWSCVIGMNAEV